MTKHGDKFPVPRNSPTLELGSCVMREDPDGMWVTYPSHQQALAAERQRIIDEMVTPLMEAIKGVTDAVTDAVQLCMFVATDADQWMNIRSEALRSQEALAAVSAKLKEAKG